MYIIEKKENTETNYLLFIYAVYMAGLLHR